MSGTPNKPSNPSGSGSAWTIEYQKYHVSGTTIEYHVSGTTIEYQKRGLPHLHLGKPAASESVVQATGLNARQSGT